MDDNVKFGIYLRQVMHNYDVNTDILIFTYFTSNIKNRKQCGKFCNNRSNLHIETTKSQSLLLINTISPTFSSAVPCSLYAGKTFHRCRRYAAADHEQEGVL